MDTSPTASAVTIRQFEEAIPCGKCITTQHIDAEGRIVRQDQNVIISPEAWAAMFGSANLGTGTTEGG